MMRFLVCGLCLVVMVASPGTAAEPPERELDALAAEPSPSPDWTGVYLGINGAGVFGQSDWGDVDASPKPKGGLIGGTAGYNRQILGAWVIGLEGDGAWADIDGSEGCGEDVTCQTKSSWLATVRGRIGYAWNPLMTFVTGGMAAGDIEANRTGFDGANDTNVGWTVGIGGEGTLGMRWTVKIEFLYVDLGDLSCSAGDCGTATKIDLRERTIRGGLNYRF